MSQHKIFESKEQGLEQFPSGHKAKIILEEVSICLVNYNGTFHALANSCPHLGDSLTKGTTNFSGEIVCPWHSYRFNLKSGEESEKRCRDVKIFKITEDATGVYIEI